MKRQQLILGLTMTVLTVLAQTDTIPMTKIVPQRLPDLNIPRFCHDTFYANGELTVTGGHTSNFVPTPTAEFLKDGKYPRRRSVRAAPQRQSAPGWRL